MGRKISDAGGRGTPGYRREWQVFFRSKSIAILWFWKVFGSVISFGAGQLAIILIVLPMESAPKAGADLRWLIRSMKSIFHCNVFNIFHIYLYLGEKTMSFF